MLTYEELYRKGFAHIGKDAQISDKCSFYSPGMIWIGDNVRIDDFCILSGKITIGNNVHISSHTSLIGKGGIFIDNYAGVSMRCSILSSNADYSGDYLTNPNLPEELLNTTHAPVILKQHSLIGAGSIVLPGVTMGIGAVCGAMSLVKGDIPSWEIWAGTPAKYIKMRKMGLLNLLLL